MSNPNLQRALADLIEARRVMQDARDMLKTAEREFDQAVDGLERAQAAYDIAKARHEAEESDHG